MRDGILELSDRLTVGEGSFSSPTWVGDLETSALRSRGIALKTAG